jgi:hypothetical protein
LEENKQQIGQKEILKNNTSYKLYFKNRDTGAGDWHSGLILESYTLTPIIRMHFNNFVNKNQLNIINYYLKYDKNIDQHILYFDTLENVDHINIKQIVDYIINNSNKLSNIRLEFMKGYITNITAEEKIEKDKKDKKDNWVDDLFDNQGSENVENILKIVTAIYLLSIIKDFTE